METRSRRGMWVPREYVDLIGTKVGENKLRHIHVFFLAHILERNKEDGEHYVDTKDISERFGFTLRRTQRVIERLSEGKFINHLYRKVELGPKCPEVDYNRRKEFE